MNTSPHMYFTTAGKTLVLLLLCSGYFNLTFSGHLRKFSAKDKKSFEKCLQENQSLVTLYDEKDAAVVFSYFQSAYNEPAGQNIWLGLKKKEKNTNVTWSDGTPYVYSNSTVNKSDLNDRQICEAMDHGTWKGFNCSEEKSFMCSKDYTLIEKQMSWCEAQQYCKKNHTDLVSINNDTENLEVIRKGKNTSFWIGLMHDDWEWQDKGCSSFRKWVTSLSAESSDTCTVLQDQSLMRNGCGIQKHCIVSSGNRRIIVGDRNLTWEEAFDHCSAHHDGILWIADKHDQEAVEQWLNHSQSTGPFWMGLRQSRVFGFWIWTSDNIVSYSNWENGIQPELPLSKHCGVIKADGKWQDENCLVPRNFLCEENMIKLD